MRSAILLHFCGTAMAFTRPSALSPAHRLAARSPGTAGSSRLAALSSSAPATAPASEEALEPVPSTFPQCIAAAQKSTGAAIDEGFKLMEIEFPPLPTDFMESPEVGRRPLHARRCAQTPSARRLTATSTDPSFAAAAANHHRRQPPPTAATTASPTTAFDRTTHHRH